VTLIDYCLIIMNDFSLSYAIIGTGALGGYYGARLHHAGRKVRFLLHNDFDHVRLHGLTVESPDGDFSIDKPEVYATPRDMPACDIVMVCLKTTANDALPDILPHVTQPGGCLLVMQNGLNVERSALKACGQDDIETLGGMAFLCSNKIGPGHIRHLDYGLIRLAGYCPDDQPVGITDTMQHIGDDLRRAGIDIVLEEDLALARWKKLVWNVPYNGLSVVFEATTDELMGCEPTRSLCEALMWEVVAAARAFGRRIDEAFVEKMLTNTRKMVRYKPSMLIDHEQDRPMEIEAIYGEPIRAAKSKGVDVPLMTNLYEQLQRIESTPA